MNIKEKYKMDFFAKSVLGSKVELEKTDSVIKCCIRKAYDDMKVAGRFCLLEKTKDSFCEWFYKELDKANYEFNFGLICEAEKQLKKNFDKKKSDRGITPFGLAQKIVNMTFKYLYVFHDYAKTKTKFDGCDCPLDSIVLGRLKKEKAFAEVVGAEKSSIVWSKITKTDYSNCQEAIRRTIEENKSIFINDNGKMAYDIYWSK